MQNKTHFKKEYEKGRETEIRFQKECEKNGIFCQDSNQIENMYGHFDFIIKFEGNEFKIDVKGLKKIDRKNEESQEDFHFLEIRNVRGQKGWLFGDADLFAFETNDYWMIVKKEKIQQLIKEKVKKEYVDSPSKCLYKLYSREGRQDIITMVKSLDLMGIASKRMRKTE